MRGPYSYFCIYPIRDAIADIVPGAKNPLMSLPRGSLSNQKYARKFEEMTGAITLKTATADLLDPPKTSDSRERISDSETEAETSSSKSNTSEIQNATSDIRTDTLDTQGNGPCANAHCVITGEPVIPSVEM